MGRPSLDGVWAKFNRGVFHLKAFDVEYARVIGSDEVGTPKSHSIPVERQVERESELSITYLFRIGTLPDIGKSDCSVIAGDALTNFRAALDHLTWIIVKRHGANVGALKRGRRNKIQFPLSKNRGAFEDDFRNQLPGVDRQSLIAGAIEDVQPYQRGNKAGSMRALRDLTNRDKHRLLISAFWHAPDIELNLTKGGWSVIEQEHFITGKRPFKSGAPMVRATLAPISMNRVEVQLNGKGTLEPGFVGSWRVIPMLKGIRATVEQIINQTRRLL